MMFLTVQRFWYGFVLWWETDTTLKLFFAIRFYWSQGSSSYSKIKWLITNKQAYMESASSKLCWFPPHDNTFNNTLFSNDSKMSIYFKVIPVGQTSCRPADKWTKVYCLAVWLLHYKGAFLCYERKQCKGESLPKALSICWTCFKRWMLQDFTLNTWTEEPTVSFTPIWFKKICLWRDLIWWSIML